jgi:hypothetical protein
VSRRRQVLSLYARTAQAYFHGGRTLLPLAVVIFLPLGLIDAFAAQVDLDSLDVTGGIKILALVAAISALTATSLLGEVFYSGTVALSLGHPEGEPPPSLREVARRLNYRRLIALDVIYVLLVIVGLIFLVVPGALIFVFLGLAGPIVELEGRTVRGAFARSFELVRRSFWVVFFVLVPVEIVGDSIAEALEGLVHTLLGDTFLAGWMAESVSNIVLSPAFAIAAVLLTLDLLAAEREDDGAARPAASSPAPASA